MKVCARVRLLPAFALWLSAWVAAGTLAADCGDSILDEAEECDDGNTLPDDGCSSSCLIEAGWTCSAPVPPVPGSNVVADPSFEGGTPSAAWSEFSDAFGTPICDPFCGGPPAPHGAWYVWLGDDPMEEAWVEQSVTIPTTATTLEFDLFVENCDSASDFMRVLIGEECIHNLCEISGGPCTTNADCLNEEFTRECTPGTEDAGFVGRSVDVSAYADGLDHTVRFETMTFGANGDVSNFFVDQVVIGDRVLQPSQCFPLVVLTCNGPPIDFDTPLPGIPADWSVVDHSASGLVWSDIPTARESGNYTGSGQAATASSRRFGPARFDTELRSAPFDLPASPPGAPLGVAYQVNYQNNGGRDFLDLDLSTDGGANWTNLLRWNEDHGVSGTAPGEAVSVDLSAYAGQSSLILGWRYYDPETNQDLYAQIDDVRLDCPAVVGVTPGSLATTQAPSTQAQQTLDIANGGVAQLVWTVEEAPSGCASTADVPWLAASPGGGTTPSSTETGVTVEFDATALTPATYTAKLCIQSNDPVTPTVEVPVTMEVAGCLDDLVLANETLTGGSFRAAISITAGPDLVSDGPVEFVAGQEIRFLSGVELRSGFSAVTSASPCP